MSSARLLVKNVCCGCSLCLRENQKNFHLTDDLLRWHNLLRFKTGIPESLEGLSRQKTCAIIDLLPEI